MTVLSTTTRRGLVYAYHYNAPSGDKSTILFLHGFPSTHRDWSSQISYFSEKGYGVIAPDLLGYGDTDAPEDVSLYKTLDMVKDIVDILDHLGVEKIVGVGHDWGSFVLSRLLNTHIDRVLGAAFLAVGYAPPQPDFDYDTQATALEKLIGYNPFGYWKFFAEDDAPALTDNHIDSFYSLIFPDDPAIWKTDLAPLGKAREWIELDKQLPLASFWNTEVKDEHQKALLKKGLKGPYNWYKARLDGINNADEASIPKEAYQINIPTFFGGALKDPVCSATLSKQMMPQTCSRLVTKDFDTSHWIMLEAPNELNEALEGFFASL